jgi:hypothetical protein
VNGRGPKSPSPQCTPKIRIAAQGRQQFDKRRDSKSTAAHQGLLRANVLFELIQFAITAGDVNEPRTLSLTAIGVELTRTYGERAQGEAKYFERMNRD